MASKKPAFRPYTMHCPKCKTGIMIKKSSLIGTRINCPKCDRKIDIVTEAEDGHVPYGVEAAPEPEPIPEPTEEELMEKALKKKKEKRKKNLETTKFSLSIFLYLAMLAGVGWVFYEFVVKKYMEGSKEKDASIVITEQYLG